MIINFFNINEEFTNLLLTETYRDWHAWSENHRWPTFLIEEPSVTDMLDWRPIGDWRIDMIHMRPTWLWRSIGDRHDCGGSSETDMSAESNRNSITIIWKNLFLYTYIPSAYKHVSLKSVSDQACPFPMGHIGLCWICNEVCRGLQ